MPQGTAVPFVMSRRFAHAPSGWRRGLTAAFVLLSAGAAAAQVPSAAPTRATGIEGVVVDSAGHPIAGARLVVRDTARSGETALRRFSGESDSSGTFRIVGLVQGAHVLEVTRDEYEPAGFRFDIATGVTAKLRITLAKDPMWAEMKRTADSLRAVEVADSIAAARRARLTPGMPVGHGTLVGRIATPDGKPVSRAQVQAMGTNYSVESDSAGHFQFVQVPAGPYFLRARKLGYEPVVFPARVVSGDSLDATITLTPLMSVRRGNQLDTVRVIGAYDRMSRRLRGYQERKAAGRGTFIDFQEIEQRHPQNLSDLLRGKANVTVQRNSNNGEVQIFGPRLSISTGYCPLALMVDGVVIPNAQGSIDTLVPVSMIAAIEVYNSGTSVPSDLARMGTDCGVIVVWTR